MINANICIATFYNGFSPKELVGISTAPIYLAHQLRKYFKNVDVISLRDQKSIESPLAYEVIQVTDPSTLKFYDLVFFASPGFPYEKFDEKNPDKYLDVLNNTRKFSILFHGETDRSLYPYMNTFLNHPNLSFFTFNCPGMSINFKDYLEVCDSWNYVSYCPILPSLDSIIEKARNKENILMSTSRWTTVKRVYEMVEMAEEFNKEGIRVYTAGAHQSYWYNLKMQELPKESFVDLDSYEPSQLPEILSKVKYHWNFLFQMKNMGVRTHRPRLEIATMEAFIEGCLPVVCEEFTPDWLGRDSAIRVSYKNYKEIPHILGGMTDSERFERLKILYDRIQENVIDHYNEFSNFVSEKIEVQ